jgi:hypothetical protein
MMFDEKIVNWLLQNENLTEQRDITAIRETN